MDTPRATERETHSGLEPEKGQGTAEGVAPSRIAHAELLSVVVPFYNEEGNAEALIEELHAALVAFDLPWELIAVNDGSRDGTALEMDRARQRFGEHICVVHLARNFGQTAAMQSGIDRARGSLIVTMDGDRQNDPADIPRLVDFLLAHDFDMVSGWRKDRQDAALQRKLPSRIANRIIRSVTGVEVKDNGCSLKIFRAHIIKGVVLMGEMHRFASAWVASVTDPGRIGEMPVNHRARTVGSSKYGLSRTTRVLLDLLVVLFYMRFARRPGHFFGYAGLTIGAAGALVLTYLLGVKLLLGEDIGGRPLLLAGVVMAIAGIQLITTGILAEILTRGAPARGYPVRREVPSESRSWHNGA